MGMQLQLNTTSTPLMATRFTLTAKAGSLKQAVNGA